MFIWKKRLEIKQVGLNVTTFKIFIFHTRTASCLEPQHILHGAIFCGFERTDSTCSYVTTYRKLKKSFTANCFCDVHLYSTLYATATFQTVLVASAATIRKKHFDIIILSTKIHLLFVWKGSLTITFPKKFIYFNTLNYYLQARKRQIERPSRLANWQIVMIFFSV
jgi:hypothetical protein